jgi:ribA/ribD-fused uncharacterized protein
MKAVTNTAHDTAHQILLETAPVKCKQLGDRVKVLDAKKWEAESVNIMKDACRAKFYQNKKLSDFLLSTGDCKLVEARKDSFWGAGKVFSELTADPKWSGSNHLGNILRQIRHELH